MTIDKIARGKRSNIIRFPTARRQRVEVWNVMYVGQSNDGWIKRTLVVRDL